MLSGEDWLRGDAEVYEEEDEIGDSLGISLEFWTLAVKISSATGFVITEGWGEEETISVEGTLDKNWNINTRDLELILAGI